jgi:hypothetical protein
MKGNKGYSLLGLLAVLFVAIAFLPVIRRTFVRSFPEGFQATGGVDSRKGDCKGVNCNEGEFCQQNTCRPVMAPITNDYFPDK